MDPVVVVNRAEAKSQIALMVSLIMGTVLIVSGIVLVGQAAGLFSIDDGTENKTSAEIVAGDSAPAFAAGGAISLLVGTLLWIYMVMVAIDIAKQNKPLHATQHAPLSSTHRTTSARNFEEF